MLPLAGLIDEARRSKLARDLYLDISRICNTTDPKTTCREELAAMMQKSAGFQVLVIPPPPEPDDSGLRDQPGVTGELKAHLPQVCRKNDQIRSATYKETDQPKYMKYAKTCRKRLQDWIRKGSPNCFHLESLLDAEHEQQLGNHAICVKNYETGIFLSGRQGLTNFRALGNERFAYYWKSRGNRDEALYRLDESIRIYKEWGAQHKAETLLTLRSSFA